MRLVIVGLMERDIMSLKFGACSTFAATLLGFALTTMPAHAYIEAGTLNCRSLGPSGYIVFSAGVLDCVFTPASGASLPHYQGTVQRFGAQIGFTNDAVLGWIVLAATSRLGPGALAGGYVGASGGATVGVGLAANGLVGGLNNSFALQPISFEGQTGLNVIATVTGLELRPVMPARPRHHRRHRR
jgi:hypothetical protein